MKQKFKKLLDPLYALIFPGQRVGLKRRWGIFLTAMDIIKWNPFCKITIFDVGANDGLSFVDLPRIMPNAQFYAFEPTPELAQKIRHQFRNAAHYHLTQKAVGETPGTATFNIADKGDGGCSSLLEFSTELEKTWKNRDDLMVTRQIEVEVIRLDAFIIENNIEKIDFLHVDAQGTDLAVLRSLGDEIKRVKAGVIEVPETKEVMLYKNQHTYEEAVDFLTSKGFEITRVEDSQNEKNLYFQRPN